MTLWIAEASSVRCACFHERADSSAEGHTSGKLLWLAKESLGTFGPGEAIALSATTGVCLADVREGVLGVSVWLDAPGNKVLPKPVSVSDTVAGCCDWSVVWSRPGLILNLALLLLNGVLDAGRLFGALIDRGGKNA